jgi:hypothetical protein
MSTPLSASRKPHNNQSKLHLHRRRRSNGGARSLSLAAGAFPKRRTIPRMALVGDPEVNDPRPLIVRPALTWRLAAQSK